MNRTAAAILLAGLAAALTGCGEEKKSDPTQPTPPASELFDKKEVPKPMMPGVRGKEKKAVQD